LPDWTVLLLSIHPQVTGIIELYRPEIVTVSSLRVTTTPGSTKSATTLVAVVPVSNAIVTEKFVRKLTEPVSGLIIV
jgi:hypothetical protein